MKGKILHIWDTESLNVWGWENQKKILNKRPTCHMSPALTATNTPSAPAISPAITGRLVFQDRTQKPVTVFLKAKNCQKLPKQLSSRFGNFCYTCFTRSLQPFWLWSPKKGTYNTKIHGNVETMFTTPYVSHVTFHMSCVTCHLSHVTCHMSPVTCNIYIFLSLFRTKFWS